MLSMPYISSTPVLYYNKDAFAQAGLDPEAPPKTWGEFGEALDALKAAGSTCPFTTAWQSWVHLETFSAWHDVPFAPQENGFGGLDAELVFNGPLQVKPIQQLGDCAQEGKFISAGRRNAEIGRPSFREGVCQ